MRRQLFRYEPDPAERLARPDTATGFPVEALRTPLWSPSERNIVLKRVQDGCWSPTEIARQVGPTKSLRQVVEYLEYVHRSSEHIRLQEEDLETVQVTEEKRNKVDWKRTQARNAFLFKARWHRKNNDTPHYNNYVLFGAKKARFLSQLLSTGSQRILVDDRIHLPLHRALEEFLQKVLKDIITRYVLTKPFVPVSYLNNKKVKVDHDCFMVDANCVKQSIVACGFELGVPSAQLCDSLLEKYVGEDKKVEALANMEGEEDEEHSEEQEEPSEDEGEEVDEDEEEMDEEGSEEDSDVPPTMSS